MLNIFMISFLLIQYIFTIVVRYKKQKKVQGPSKQILRSVYFNFCVLTVALKSHSNCMPMPGVTQRPAYIIVSAVLAEVAPALVLHYNSAPAPPSHVACACVLQSQLCVSWVGRSASADARDLFSEGRQLFSYFQINAKCVGFESS